MTQAERYLNELSENKPSYGKKLPGELEESHTNEEHEEKKPVVESA